MALPLLRLFTALLMALLAATAALGAASAERVALVVGNANYPGNPLANPGNDARAVADLLGRAGFQVESRYDTSREALLDSVTRFGQRLRDPQIKLAVFFYAGHGLQLDWRNYLVPVDARVRNAADVQRQTVDASELIKFMNESRGRSFVAILDACREDPFLGSFRPPAKGLSPFDAPSGSLLAYSTAPGQVAYDGKGSNSLYTKHLVHELASPDVSLEDAFKRVRLNVRMESGGRQIPWESTSLEGAFFFAGAAGGAAPTGAAGQRGLSEKELWDVIAGAGTASGYRAYLEKYPQGAYADQAQARLAAATATSSTRTPEAERPGSRPPPPGTPAAPGAGFSFSAAEAQLDRQSSAGRVSAARRALADMPCPPERRRARVQLQVGESSRGAILGPALAAFLREAGVRVVSQGTSEYRVRGSASTQVGLDWSTGLQQVSITSVLELAGPRGPLLPNRVARDETYAGRDVQAAMDELVLRHAGEWAPQIFEAICNR